MSVALFALADASISEVNPTPPTNPAIGSCYIVGDEPEGAWIGHALALAGYTDGGWRFIAPFDRLAAFEKASGQSAVFAVGAWEIGHVRVAKLSIAGDQVVGPRLPTVAVPAGGSVVDTEARSAIGAILARLQQHGLIES